MPEADRDALREDVRARYAARALRVIEDPAGGCCGGGACDPISRDLYGALDAAEVTRVHERPELAGRVEGRLVSAFVRARKPVGA